MYKKYEVSFNDEVTSFSSFKEMEAYIGIPACTLRRVFMYQMGEIEKPNAHRLTKLISNDIYEDIKIKYVPKQEEVREPKRRGRPPKNS